MEVKEASAQYLLQENPVCPKGYKQTEAGMIPEDWVEHTISNLIDFEGGSQPDKSVFSPVMKPGYVRLIQIRDYKTDKYETYVPRNLARRFCTENDIMIGRYGPPIFQILRGLSGAYNVALIKAKPHDEINGNYAYYFLTQEKLFTFIEKLSQRSSGQTGVDLKELRAYSLPLPPTKAEQQAIAEALSDADALIESLQQLLTKKRQLKQGAMQQLLTGKKRLPGFSGEWEVKRLGEFGECLRGVSYRGDSDLSTFDTITTKRLLRSNNVQDAIVITTNIQFVNSERVKEKQLLRENDILICMANGSKALVGKAGLFRMSDGYDYTFGAFMGCFRTNGDEANATFVFFLFQTARYRNYINNLLAGSSINNLTPGSIESLEFAIPEPEEQTAIATILSDMDTDIAALEQKLTKARAIKQGMMQELLTGRIRLL